MNGRPAGAMNIDQTRAARSVLWSVVENGGLALVSFGSLVVYSRFLGATDFGVFSIVLALVELLDVLVAMLFHDALVQRKDATRMHFDTAFTVTVVLSLLLFAGCALFSTTFARLVHNAAAGPVLRWTALRLPCTAIAATIVAQQRRELDFRTLALRSLAGRLAGAGLGIFLVLRGAGIWGLVAQQVLIALMGSLVLWAAAPIRPRLAFGRAELRQLVAFGSYSVGALFLSFSVKRLFTIVTGVMLGNATAGYLNLSFRAVDVLWAIAATALTQVALPILSRLQSEPARLARAYDAALEFACFVLYPCFVGIAVVAPEFVAILFGRQWVVTSSYVSALALLILVQAPRLLITPTLTAVGRPRDSMIGIAAEMLVVLLLIFAFRVASVGWAIAIWSIRELVAAPVMAFVLRRATGIGIIAQLKSTLVPAVASLSMVAAVCSVRLLLPAELGPAVRLMLLAPAGAVAFLAVAALVGAASLKRVLSFVSAAVARSPTGAWQVRYREASK